MSDFKLIKTEATSVVSEVRFYAETVAHIEEEHPEVPINLPSVYDAVGKAVTEPSHVEESYSSSFVFVDADSTSASGDPLRVPVRIIGSEGTSARVKSAYFAATPSAAKVIWRRK